MFWSVVGRILWARRLIIAVVSLGSLAGGALVMATATPLYDATARVMLNVANPDPVTGATLGKKTIDPYLQTQLSLIRDYQVVGPAIEAVGWFDNPDVIAAYNARPPTDRRPLTVWLAQSVIASMQTALVDGSNIIEIKYRGESPELAELVAGAIRDAYIAANIRQRRASAAEDADRQADRAEALRAELEKLQAQKRALEAETGVMLSAGGDDLEGQRLLALSSPSKATAPPDTIVSGRPSAQGALGQLDLELAQAEANLGPNHPALIELRSTRASLAAQVAAEARTADGVAAAIVAREGAKQATLDAQRERVLSQRQDVLRVRLVQDQINLKSKALEQATTQVATMRQLATLVESGLTPVGQVESDPTPAFPHLPLVLGGTAGIGLFAGIVIALLVEMLNLRVRTRVDLRIATDLPLLGSFPPLRDHVARPTRRGFRLRRLSPVTT